MKKIRALIAFQIKVALDNKIDFLYTFIMPLAYLLVNFFPAHQSIFIQLTSYQYYCRL